MQQRTARLRNHSWPLLATIRKSATEAVDVDAYHTHIHNACVCVPIIHAPGCFFLYVRGTRAITSTSQPTQPSSAPLAAAHPASSALCDGAVADRLCCAPTQARCEHANIPHVSLYSYTRLTAQRALSGRGWLHVRVSAAAAVVLRCVRAGAYSLSLSWRGVYRQSGSYYLVVLPVITCVGVIRTAMPRVVRSVDEMEPSDCYHSR